MRKYLSIILLVIMILNAGALFLGLQLRQGLHKAVVSLIIDSRHSPAEIVTIRITQEQFDEVKIHDGEFRHNGGMYDVVWKENDGGHLILYCYHDHAEEKIAAKILGFLAKHTLPQSLPLTINSSTLYGGCTLFIPESAFLLYSIAEVGCCNFQEKYLVLNRQTDVDFPPPRTASL